jgi:hypothetical protein
MATELDHERIALIKRTLKVNGFDNCLSKSSVDCIVAGIDADDFTYGLVALFITFILNNSMRSHNDLVKKAAVLGQNSRAIVDVLAAVTQELMRNIDAEMQVEAKVQAALNDKGAAQVVKPEEIAGGDGNATKH